jgi:hypothetical protein
MRLSKRLALSSAGTLAAWVALAVSVVVVCPRLDSWIVPDTARDYIPIASLFRSLACHGSMLVVPFAEGAEQFANASINSGRRMTITSIEVPESIVARGTRFSDPGGGGASVHFADDVLLDVYREAGLPAIVDAPWIRALAPGIQ